MKKFVSAAYKAFLDLFTRKIFYRSATISYFSLILLFPLLTLIMLGLSYLPVNPSEVSSVFERYFPSTSTHYLKIVENLAAKRVSYGLISTVLAFVFASNLFVVISNSLAEVTESDYKSLGHKIFTQILSVPLFFILLIVGYIFTLIISVLTNLLDFTGQMPLLQTLSRYISASRIVSFISIWLFNLFIYKFLIPAKFPIKTLLIVSIFVTFLFVIFKALFALIFSYLIRVNPVYGTFSSILGFLLWIYISSAILLYGGRMLFYLRKV